MMYQPQKKVILARELKVGMIVVDKYSISLMLFITKEKITWINMEYCLGFIHYKRENNLVERKRQNSFL